MIREDRKDGREENGEAEDQNDDAFEAADSRKTHRTSLTEE